MLSPTHHHTILTHPLAILTHPLAILTHPFTTLTHPLSINTIERERQREREIRAFREFSTHLPFKHPQPRRAAGSSYIGGLCYSSLSILTCLFLFLSILLYPVCSILSVLFYPVYSCRYVDIHHHSPSSYHTLTKTHSTYPLTRSPSPSTTLWPLSFPYGAGGAPSSATMNNPLEQLYDSNNNGSGNGNGNGSDINGNSGGAMYLGLGPAGQGPGRYYLTDVHFPSPSHSPNSSSLFTPHIAYYLLISSSLFIPHIPYLVLPGGVLLDRGVHPLHSGGGLGSLGAPHNHTHAAHNMMFSSQPYHPSQVLQSVGTVCY